MYGKFDTSKPKPEKAFAKEPTWNMMYCFESDDDAEEIQPQGVDLNQSFSPNATSGHIDKTPKSKAPTWNMMYCFESDEEVEPQDASADQTTASKARSVPITHRSMLETSLMSLTVLDIVDGEENKLRSLLKQPELNGDNRDKVNS